MIKSEFNADFAISNGGGLRADTVFEEGLIKFSFLARVVPITEKVVKGSLTGRNLKEIMEHGLSNASSLDGRWPVISGFRIKFDPTKKKGERIVLFEDEFGKEIDLDKRYTLGAPYWLFAGRDGYTAFLDEDVELSKNHPDEAPTMQDIVMDWFDSFSKSDEEI